MKRTISQGLKKSVSAILAASMSLSLFTVVPVSADICKTTYNYDGYSVDYNITNEWDGAQTVELTVSNTGTDSILNWALKYDAEGEINNLWNATLYEQSDSEYVIKNTGWNFEIVPNQSVTYGYTLNGSDLSLPDSFEIYSKRVEKTEGYDVSYNITKSWDTGVEGNIVISNTSNAAIEAWTLSFDSNFNVDHLWNGRVLENNGTSYTVAAEMWTNPVQPNSTMTIGFVGSKAVDVEAALDNFRLTEVVIGEGTPVIPIDPPVEDIEISANAALQESGDIAVSWTSNKQEGTFDILMSADGVNFTSVGTVTGASEYLYTPDNDFETLYFKVVQTVGEQSAESNIVSVVNNKSSEDIVISAAGVYDEESGDITISWETNTDNGSFEIFVSNDGENFTSVGTVTGASEYIYTPESDFETLYFKVIQTVGEQSIQSNVVIISNDSEAIVITAKAYIDEESDGIKIEWTTTKPSGKFEIFMSEDKENFTSVGAIENAGEFVYSPEKSFLTLYFKVKQTVGNKSAESNVERVIDWYNDLDSDEDGISNLDEIYTYFTDPANPDTDGDGLPDGYEIFTLDTDPLSGDTDENGIADGDEDIDGDGLTNITEYQLGTSPRDKDSDEDGLTDGDEVHTYGTDPLKFDTDGDNVSDGDEIALGLDPNNAATNGVPDNERTFAQTIPADDWLFYNINTENNPFEFSVEITAAGVALNNIEASFSGYSYSMRNDAILGNIPEFSYNENLKIDDIKINFDLDKSVINSYNDKYKDISEELSGIKRFNVFRYFEDTNMLLPIETFHDEVSGRVYAHTTETGTYCLIDMAAWLDSLGFEEYISNKPQPVMTYAAERAASSDIDIIFILHSSIAYADFIKDELANVISSAYSYGNSVHMHFISSGGDIYMINGRKYAETAEECMNILRRFRGSAASENVNKAFLAAKGLELRDGSQRYMFMFDGLSMPACGSANANLNDILKNDVNFGIICNSESNNIVNYNKLANNNVRENIVVFKDFILDQINFADIVEDEEYVITANGLVLMPEDFGDISIDSEQDYDRDGLSDVTEINFDVTGEDGNALITVNDDGSVVLPNFYECVAAGGTYIEEGLKRFYDEADDSVFEFLNVTKVLPLKSDPTSRDGDGDGILDSVEYEILFCQLLNNVVYMNKSSLKELLYQNNIIDVYGFNTKITEDMADRTTKKILDAYSLANEKDILSSGGCNYGYLGSWNDVFYLEAYCEKNSDGQVISNELRINANINFSKTELQLVKEYDGKNKVPSDEKICFNEIITTIENEWSMDNFKGDIYDFYGMKVKVRTVINICNDEYKPSRYADFNLIDGSSWPTTKPLSPNNKKTVIIPNIKDKTPVDKDSILNTCAHEFGHVLGIADLYGCDYNNYIRPVTYKNISEISFNADASAGDKTSHSMMFMSGIVSTNEIEMAIYARKKKQPQFFVPGVTLAGVTYELSEAIRDTYFYVYVGNDTKEMKNGDTFFFKDGAYVNIKLISETDMCNYICKDYDSYLSMYIKCYGDYYGKIAELKYNDYKEEKKKYINAVYKHINKKDGGV